MIIAFPSKPSKQGGPGSFQRKFEKSLKLSNWEIVYPDDNVIPDIILILGGTRKLIWLLKMKRKGVKIIFRLGGINWLYKVKEVSFLKRIILDFKIFLLTNIQKYLADGIIYQSHFSKKKLIELGQSADVNNNTIIFNGVDIDKFSPLNEINKEEISLLCVESNIDYSPHAVNLLNELQEKLINNSGYKSIILYGNFENLSNKKRLHPRIIYKEFISGDEIYEIYRNAVYLSLDVNAACPNTVIEALASGIPVIGYDTGALKELVPPEAGEIVPFGGDQWELEPPNIQYLIDAAEKVLMNWKYYSENARKTATDKYNLNLMVKKYIDFITNV